MTHCFTLTTDFKSRLLFKFFFCELFPCEELVAEHVAFGTGTHQLPWRARGRGLQTCAALRCHNFHRDLDAWPTVITLWGLLVRWVLNIVKQRIQPRMRGTQYLLSSDCWANSLKRWPFHTKRASAWIVKRHQHSNKSTANALIGDFKTMLSCLCKGLLTRSWRAMVTKSGEVFSSLCRVCVKSYVVEK